MCCFNNDRVITQTTQKHVEIVLMTNYPIFVHLIIAMQFFCNLEYNSENTSKQCVFG